MFIIARKHITPPRMLYRARIVLESCSYRIVIDPLHGMSDWLAGSPGRGHNRWHGCCPCAGGRWRQSADSATAHHPAATVNPPTHRAAAAVRMEASSAGMGLPSADADDAASGNNAGRALPFSHHQEAATKLTVYCLLCSAGLRWVLLVLQHALGPFKKQAHGHWRVKEVFSISISLVGTISGKSLKLLPPDVTF